MKIKKEYKKRMTAQPLEQELQFSYFLNKISDFYCEQITRLVGTTKKEMMSGSRMIHITTGRHALCYVMRTYHGNIVTLQSIATLLGRHHSSIIHSVNAVDPYLPNWRFINKIKRMTDDDLLAILQPETQLT
jgi:chromosomal replication initiation ATPase DnaA